MAIFTPIRWNARLQLRMVWLHGNNTRTFMLQISSCIRASQVLGTKQDGKLSQHLDNQNHLISLEAWWQGERRGRNPNLESKRD